MLKSVGLAMVLTCVLYLAVGVMAIHIFGTDLKSNLMLSIESIGPLALLMQVTFLLLLICHIPFVFICAKEGTCIVADEFINGTLTKAISSITKETTNEVKAVEAQIIIDMDNRVYYGVTVMLYIVCLLLAIKIDNLLILFDYLSALTVSGIQFFIPGICYVILSRGHPDENANLKGLSYLYIFISFVVTVTIMYSL